MGAWISFRFKNDFGKLVGHTAFINNAADLQEILGRYHVDPHFLFDIKVNNRTVGIEAIVKKLNY